jgi:electron transfer flavoprotein beta subunit
LKVLVLLKPTPDTETKIRLSSDNKNIEMADVKYVINPYDEFAIEEALKIKEKAGKGEVIIASFGQESVRELVIKGLAMGADRGLIISNARLENTDSLGVARILQAIVSSENPDLVLCGKQAIDDDNMHVGVMTAELLDWPHVNVVTKIEILDGKAKVMREVEGGQVEVYEVSLPAILGAHKSLNTPRYASLPGIMKAKKKPIDLKNPADLGLNLEELKSKTQVKINSYAYPPEKPQGKLFQGEELDVMVSKVVNLLRDEAKII